MPVPRYEPCCGRVCTLGLPTFTLTGLLNQGPTYCRRYATLRLFYNTLVGV